MFHQLRNWKCMHLDYVLVFVQASTDTDAHMKIPTGFHVKDSDGQCVSELYCLTLLKTVAKLEIQQLTGMPSYPID